MKAIVLVSLHSLPLAETIRQELGDALVYTTNKCEGCITIDSYTGFFAEHFSDFDAIIFIGAMGICVRTIASYIKNKYEDPAVICVDSTGKYVIPVLSGHIGGANDLSRRIASIVGGEAIVTTQSDNEELWALDTLASRYS